MRTSFVLLLAFPPSASALLSVKPITSDAGYHSLREATRSTGRIAIVEFSSETCAACKIARPLFERMAAMYDEVEWHEQLYESSTKAHFKSCGIAFLPHVHIIQDGVAIESFSCPPSKLYGRIGSKLHSLVAPLRPHRGWLNGRRWHSWRIGRRLDQE